MAEVVSNYKQLSAVDSSFHTMRILSRTYNRFTIAQRTEYRTCVFVYTVPLCGAPSIRKLAPMLFVEDDPDEKPTQHSGVVTSERSPQTEKKA